jgi:hypothetical protein
MIQIYFLDHPSSAFSKPVAQEIIRSQGPKKVKI